MNPPASLARALADAWNDAYALAFPVACAGCGTPSAVMCDGCRQALTPAPHPVPLGDGLVAHAGLPFDGVTAATLRALKQDGRTGLVRHLAPALGAAVGAALAAPHPTPTRVAVVPIPTSRASMRRRGYRVVELLARRAGIRTVPLLTPARRTGDQRHLDRDARRDNVRGAFRAMRGLDAGGLDVVIIDDVVTTGATLEAAAHTLRSAGARVVGAATVAATPLRIAQADDAFRAVRRTPHDSPENDG